MKFKRLGGGSLKACIIFASFTCKHTSATMSSWSYALCCEILWRLSCSDSVRHLLLLRHCAEYAECWILSAHGNAYAWSALCWSNNIPPLEACFPLAWRTAEGPSPIPPMCKLPRPRDSQIRSCLKPVEKETTPHTNQLLDDMFEIDLLPFGANLHLSETRSFHRWSQDPTIRWSGWWTAIETEGFLPARSPLQIQPAVGSGQRLLCWSQPDEAMRGNHSSVFPSGQSSPQATSIDVKMLSLQNHTRHLEGHHSDLWSRSDHNSCGLVAFLLAAPEWCSSIGICARGAVQYLQCSTPAIPSLLHRLSSPLCPWKYHLERIPCCHFWLSVGSHPGCSLAHPHLWLW